MKKITIFIYDENEEIVNELSLNRDLSPTINWLLKLYSKAIKLSKEYGISQDKAFFIQYAIDKVREEILNEINDKIEDMIRKIIVEMFINKD